MTAASTPMKRVRLTLVIGSSSGSTVAEGVVEGVMPSVEQPMITLGMAEQPMSPQVDLAKSDVRDDAASASTQLVPPEEAGQPSSPAGVDQVLLTQQGKEWYRQWKEGVVDDQMVRQRWGEDVMELFHSTLAMELVIPSPAGEPLAREMVERDSGAQELESDEERRGREIAEGAVDGRPGYVEVMMTGENAGGMATEEGEHGSAMEMDLDEQVLSGQGLQGEMLTDGNGILDTKHGEDEEVAVLMQVRWADKFAAHLHDLL